MDPTTLVSLKPESGAWGGIADDSVFGPSFRRLDGCYVSKDGSEIRRAPGLRLSGRPYYGQEWSIANITGTSTWEITLASGTQDDDECYLPTNLVALFRGTGEPALDNQVLAGVRTGPNTFTVPGTGSSPGSTIGGVLIQRLHSVHALAYVGRQPVSVIETEVTADAAGTPAARRNVAVAVCGRPLSFDDPPEARIRANDGAGFVLWPSPTMTGVTKGERTYADGAATAAAQHIRIYRRIQVDTLQKRVLLAVPGSAVLHQADLGNAPPWQPVNQGVDADLPEHRWTKMLGIPRGAISNVTAVDGSGSLTASDPPNEVYNWYGLAVAYWDPFTQEVGLLSEVWAALTGNHSAPRLDVTVPRPRWAAPECVGLGIILFASTTSFATAEEAETAVLVPAAYAGPFGHGTAGTSTLRDDLYWRSDGAPGGTAAAVTMSLLTEPAPEAQLLPGRMPVIELPPPGAAVIRTVRGRWFAGGAYPESVSLNAWTWREPPGGGYTLDRGTELWLPSDGGFASDTNLGPGAHGTIPDGWAGYRVQRNAFTVGQGRGILLGSVNARYRPTTTTLGLPLRGWRVDFEYGTNFVGAAPTAPELDEFVIQVPQTRLAYPEEGFPAVCPGVNRLDLDSIVGERNNGAARVGDALLAMTERETVLFSWNAAPRQSSQVVVSNAYGCIAPGSVVEGPFGSAWFSAEGPVQFDGSGILWIGARIRQLWDTFARDSRGEMHHVTAAVDLERALVVWAVRTAEFDSEDDEERAKEGADTLLVWSYTTGAFTTITPSAASAPMAVGRLPYDDGRLRVTLSTESDFRRDLYGWVEDAGDRYETPSTFAIAQARAAGSGVAETGVSVIAHLLGDHAYVRSADGQVIRWWGTIQPNTPTSLLLEDADGADWRIGDRLTVGIVPTVIETNRIRVGELGLENVVAGIVIQAEVEADHAFVHVVAANELGEESTFAGRWGVRLFDGVTRLRAGQIRGADVALTFRVVADGQVRIRDIQLEVQPS